MSEMKRSWTGQPTDLNQIEEVFPASVTDIMPKYDDIPKEFKNWNSRNKWQRLTSEWFYKGVHGHFIPKEGIDLGKALRHIKTVLGSWEPKHEHKEAAVAYMMSLWFEDFKPTEPEKTEAPK